MWTVGLRSASLAARDGLHNGSSTAALMLQRGQSAQKSPRSPKHAYSSVSLSSPLIDTRQSPKKGFGVYAKADIPAFTRIVSDKPLILITQNEDLPQIYQQYEALSPGDAIRFMQYHRETRPEREDALSQKLSARGYPDEKIKIMVQVASVFQANAFNVQDLDGEGRPITKRAIFPTIARINHSCVPNAHTYYNPKSRTMDVHTICDCAPDTEIEIAYFNPLLPITDRQARASAWQFDCGCSACAGSKEIEEKHATRRRRIVELEGNYLKTMLGEQGLKEKLPGQMEEMVDLVEEDYSLLAQLPNAYDYLGMAHIMQLDGHSDPELLKSQAQDCLKASAEAEARITGQTSPAAVHRWNKLNIFQDQAAKG